MTRYIWQGADWPNLNCDLTRLATTLAAVRHRQGQLLGRMQALGFSLRDEAWLQTLTQDVVRTSEIEGERLDVVQVRSSLARRLGIEIGGLAPVDRHVEGIVEILVNATQRFAEPLTTKRLFNWHGALFPTGRSGLKQIRVAGWRDDAEGPMQVVSGALGREKLHFIAPPAAKLESEMTRFLSWYEQEDGTDLVMKAGLAHLWFVTLHPFDDGNGRIARALSDMALARSEQTSQRFYSLSAQMQHERSEYYQTLERTQKRELTVTEWMSWFLDCLQRALERCLGSGLKLSELRVRFQSLPTPYPSFRKECIWLDRTDEDLEERIEARTKAMIRKGLVEETESLVEQGFLANHSASSSVGYREAYAFLRNEISRTDLVSSICRSTRQLVAKQRKWFRKRFPVESRLLLDATSIVRADELKWCSGT